MRTSSHGRTRAPRVNRRAARRSRAGHRKIDEQAHTPCHRQGVRHAGQGQNASGGCHAPAAGVPSQCHGPEAQSQRHVEIEEAHVEHPAVGQHGDAGQQVPGRRPDTAATKAKAPQMNISTASETAMRCAASAPRGRNRPLRIRSKRTLVVWLAPPQALGAAALDQLRQPGVVDVAGKVAGLNARLPVAGSQQQQRKAPGRRQAAAEPRRNGIRDSRRIRLAGLPRIWPGLGRHRLLQPNSGTPGSARKASPPRRCARRSDGCCASAMCDSGPAASRR